ncbi:hypothetical protein ACJJTC_010091 [Scirpophaga incertulas]
MRLVIIILCTLQYLTPLNSENCSRLQCSNIIDYVCGLLEKDGIAIIRTYQNICYLHKIKCMLKFGTKIHHVPDELCNIKKVWGHSRRFHDFGIVGAHQACNHTCPTYCVDTYEPACARIWTGPEKYKYRPMINHCHIDMLSCAAGVNVTVEPLAKCFINPSGLLFMMQMAELKSLNLIGDASPEPVPNRKHINKWTTKKLLQDVNHNPRPPISL